jgi:hypothetical protein
MFRTTDLRAEAVHDQSSPLEDFGKLPRAEAISRFMELASVRPRTISFLTMKLGASSQVYQNSEKGLHLVPRESAP